MATTKAQPLLIAGSVLAVLGLGYATFGRSKKGKTSTSTDIVVSDLDDGNDNHDMISADEVSQVFDRLFRELQGIFAQLMQNIQMIRMQGQHIPEAQVMALVQKEMINALTAKQAQALEEYDMDYECFEQATWDFLDETNGNVDKYPQVKRAVDRFQKFWANVSGQDDIEGWRPGKEPVKIDVLSPERTVEVAQVYFDSLTVKMTELVSDYKEQGKDLQNPAVQQQLNVDFSEHAQKSGEDALLAIGTSMKQFETSVKAHSENPTVNKSIQEIQMKQQQDLMGIGSAANN